MEHAPRVSTQRRGRGPGLWPFHTVVPREHGAWAMWTVPGIVGAALAGEGYPLSALFLLAVFLLFWARYPVWQWVRSRPRAFRLADYSANIPIGLTGLALVAYIAVAHERWALLPIGALAVVAMGAHIWLVSSRKERDAVAELLGIFGLGIVGPSTYYAASGTVDASFALTWLLPTLFFGTSVFSVKLRVEGYALTRAGRETRGLLAALAGYQALVFAVVFVLIATNIVPLRVVAFYVPVTLQAAWLSRNLKRPPVLKNLGLVWVVQSILFTTLVIALV